MEMHLVVVEKEGQFCQAISKILTVLIDGFY